MKKAFYIALFLLTGLCPVHAQPTEPTGQHKLNSIVIQTRSSFLPGTFVMQRDSIRSVQQSQFNLGQYLATEPSVNIKQYGPAGIGSPAFRGTGAGHTQVYWNGIPINSPLLGQSDLSLGTVGMFDGIQTIYGAGSLNYGAGGFGGALLLNSFNQLSLAQKLALSAQVEAGSFNNFRGMGQVGVRSKRFSSTTKFLYHQGKNDFPFQSGNSPSIRRTEHSAVNQLSALQQFQWDVGPRHKPLTFQTWVSSMDRELPPAEFASNLSEYQKDQSIRSQLGWKSNVRGQATEIQLAHNYETLDYRQELTGLESESAFHGLTLRLHGHTYIEDGKKKLIDGWGIQIGADRALFSNRSLPLTEGRGTFHLKSRLFKRYKLEIISLIRESWQGNRLSLPFGTITTSWSPHQRHSFHANVSRNQRFPTLNDRYWDPGGNPDLLPESGYGTEIGWLFHPGPNYMPGNLFGKLHLNAFANLVNQWIQWIPGTGSVWTPQNVHQVGNLGGEVFVELRKKMGPWAFDLTAAYTIVRSQSLSSEIPNDNSVGNQLIYTPVHRANLRLSASFKGWSFVAQEALNGRSYITRDNQSWLPGYALANLRLGKSLQATNSQFELYAAVNNIFNVNYRTVAARPMPRRNFNLGLRMNLKHFGP